MNELFKGIYPGSYVRLIIPDGENEICLVEFNERKDGIFCVCPNEVDYYYVDEVNIKDFGWKIEPATYYEYLVEQHKAFVKEAESVRSTLARLKKKIDILESKIERFQEGDE